MQVETVGDIMSRKLAPPHPAEVALRLQFVFWSFLSTKTGERLGEGEGRGEIPRIGTEDRSRHSWHALMRGWYFFHAIEKEGGL